MSRLTEALNGKTVDVVLKNEHVLVIRCTDATELVVSWVDELGNPTAGEPKVVSVGVNIEVQPQLVRLPSGHTMADVFKDMTKGRL